MEMATTSSSLRKNSVGRLGESTLRRRGELPSNDELAETAELIRRAILTISVAPDRERRWLTQEVSTLEVVRDLEEAYGYEEARRPKFRPQPRDVDNCLIVLSWLAALKAEPGSGRRDFNILWARAFKKPWWSLAQRYGKADRTIQRWHDNAILHVHLRYRSNDKRTLY
jgi:hypothetical protein